METTLRPFFNIKLDNTRQHPGLKHVGPHWERKMVTTETRSVVTITIL